MTEAIEQADEALDFDDWEGSEDKFALRVNGNSMIDEHIADGDYVVIHRQETAATARSSPFATTRARRRSSGSSRRRHRVRLEPANKTMKPIFRDRVEILGVLVGVVRKY